jgi:hypothetical protein
MQRLPACATLWEGLRVSDSDSECSLSTVYCPKGARWSRRARFGSLHAGTPVGSTVRGTRLHNQSRASRAVVVDGFVGARGSGGCTRRGPEPRWPEPARSRVVAAAAARSELLAAHLGEFGLRAFRRFCQLQAVATNGAVPTCSGVPPDRTSYRPALRSKRHVHVARNDSEYWRSRRLESARAGSARA